jgi:hypothetical protein
LLEISAESRSSRAIRKIVPRELPVEGRPGGFPAVLKIEDALGECVEIGEIAGR